MKCNTYDTKIVLEKLTDIFIITMILFFPFIVDKTGYFQILECKWYSYITICLTYFSGCIIVLLYSLIFKRENIFQKLTFSKIQLLSLLFFIAYFLSFCISPFRKDFDLLVGVGRGEGLLISSLYIFSFLFITLFGKFKKIYILFFSISSILENGIIILQFLGFNPFNMYQDIYLTSFVGTIGNIDFVSAYLCIVLSISFASYVFLDKMNKWYKIINILSIFMSFMVISIIDVLNIKVSSFATLVIILPFILSNNRYLSRTVFVIGLLLEAYCLDLFLNPQYQLGIRKMQLHITFNNIVVTLFIVGLILFLLSYILSHKKYDFSKKSSFIKKSYIVIALLGLLIIVFLYFIKLPIGVFSEIHELLHGNFDDKFGTYRIFLWKRTISIIPQYPIFGSGPDSFAIRFMPRYVEQIESIGTLALNDTAANVYLTMIVNLGFVGIISYLTFLFSQVRIGIKKMNTYSSILLVAFICYIVQDFFNLSVVIVTPIYWVLMAVHFLSLKTN